MQFRMGFGEGQPKACDLERLRAHQCLYIDIAVFKKCYVVSMKESDTRTV